MLQLRVCKTLLLQLFVLAFVTQESLVWANGEGNAQQVDATRPNTARNYPDNDLVAALRQQTEDGMVGVAPVMSPDYYGQLKRSWKNLQGGWGKRGGSESMEMPSLEELSDYLDATRDSHANVPIEDYINAIAMLHGGGGNSNSYGPEEGRMYESKRAWKNMNSSWGKRLSNGGGGVGGEAAGGNWNKFRGVYEVPRRRPFVLISELFPSHTGAWGKREPGWNNLKGLWGKRSGGSGAQGSGWNKLSSSWGK
jgi:hypothetical protein